MKPVQCIPGLSVIISGLSKVKKYIRIIEDYRAAGNTKEEQKAIMEACRIFSEHVAQGLDVTCNVIHPENLPKEGPVVFISNHQSYADILVFLYVIRNHQIGFIAKEELSRVPIVGKWITRIRGIYIERGDARASLGTINEGVRYLKDGFSMVIFPEGTRSQGGDMIDFKPGSFKLATKARVPIVPISIEGSYHVYEEQGYIKKGQTIDFMVHPAIDVASMDRSQFAQLPQQIEDIVRSGLETLRKK